MRTRRTLALCLLSCLTLAAGLLPGAAAAQSIEMQNTASESYYRLDVPNGTVTARVEVTVQNSGARDMTTAVLWGMPQAQNIIVMRGEDVLQTKVTPSSDVDDLATVVEVTLPRSLKQNARMDLVMSYDVPAQQTEFVKLAPGTAEALFVSQGPGSFVLLDLPAEAENVLDPGCLVAAKQPNDVKDAGLQRWVCGEVTLIALAPDDPKLLERCANLDDRCRQRLDESPYSAFVQSTTDPSLFGQFEEVLNLGKGPVTLKLRYFKSDKAWADEQWSVAKRALPLLEAAYGFQYPHDTLLLRQSHHIGLIGAAGVAFSNVGEILVASGGSDDSYVMIHELAHQWAGYQLETSWLWEGLAEYASSYVAAELGIAARAWGWESLGYTDPLATWWNGSGVTESWYWYGKAKAFWLEYEKAIGGRENMIRVLSQVDDYEEEWGLDGEWFLDRGEEVSGANLDELFLTWVFNRDTAAPLLASRREAHNAAGAIRLRAAELGFTGLPTDLQSRLNEWQFNGVPGQVTEATKVLDDYVALIVEVEALGLPQLDNVKNAWNTESIRGVAGVILEQRNALRAIANTTTVLQQETEGAPSLKQLEEARAKWAEGDLREANRLAAAAATTSFNEDAAVKMIALAREKQATFKAGFLGRVGLFLKDPEGDVTRAEAAYEAGDPTKAMELAQGAYEDWNTADRSGLMRLSALMGLMCLLSGGVWWLLRRLDEPGPVARTDPHAVQGGHNLGDPEARRPNWKDWENSN